MNISDVAVLGRLREADSFLEALVSRLLARGAQIVPQPCWTGPPIRVVDGSIFAGPGKNGGRLRLHASYDPVAGRFVTLELTEVKKGEALARAAIEPGAVAVADRNYAKTRELRSLSRRNAFFLVRSSPQAVQMLEPETGKRLKSQDILNALGDRDSAELTVWLREGRPAKGQSRQPPFQIRLIILRATDKQKAHELARIERSKTRHGARPKAQTWDMAGVIVLATNLDAQTWSIPRLAALYRLRWQIELAFKTLKSTFQMRQTPAKDPRLSRTWILANLAAALLANILADTLQGALPPSRPDKPLQATAS